MKFNIMSHILQGLASSFYQYCYSFTKPILLKFPVPPFSNSRNLFVPILLGLTATIGTSDRYQTLCPLDTLYHPPQEYELLPVPLINFSHVVFFSFADSCLNWSQTFCILQNVLGTFVSGFSSYLCGTEPRNYISCYNLSLYSCHYPTSIYFLPP